ncbi:MAG: 2-C-methyl-D-erythritol 4-phosphate cytidylyltransferase [Bacilli bacterium]|nr:2-C-methyl-D-erythritol 4-phosphate cytidylyltransferase [Bacilli bacterium]
MGKKNIAVILAAGSGDRMNLDIPKQFVNVNGKPVIIYTLEAFEKLPQIDAIEVVCVNGWEDILKDYIKNYNIKKVKWIVAGGNNCQESIRNGLYNLENKINENDNVIIHDGVRPLLDEEIILDVISKCNLYGNGVSSLPYNEQIFIKDSNKTANEYIPRDKLVRMVTPQAYNFKLIISAYREAFEKSIGIGDTSYANTMMVELGHKLYLAAGSEKNIKLTTKDNLLMFKAMLAFDDNIINE